jgi:hypothetical protein
LLYNKLLVKFKYKKGVVYEDSIHQAALPASGGADARSASDRLR